MKAWWNRRGKLMWWKWSWHPRCPRCNKKVPDICFMADYDWCDSCGWSGLPRATVPYGAMYIWAEKII